MGLMISKNGSIQDYTRKGQTAGQRRVHQVSQGQEDQEKNQSSQHQSHSGEEESHRSQAMQSYQKLLNNKNMLGRQGLTAEHLGSKNLITVLPETTVGECLQLMRQKKIHHLPLIDKEGVLQGIVSDRDLLGQRERTLVETLATKEVLVTKTTTDIKVLSLLMLEEHVSAIPLVNEKNQVVGIVTKTDILRAVMEHLPFFARG